MCFPAARVGKAWPTLALPWQWGGPTAAGTWPSSAAGGDSPQSSRPAGEADLPPAQSSLAQPGSVLQLQPVLPSGLLPVWDPKDLGDLRRPQGDPGRNILVPVMPARSGKPRALAFTLDSRQSALCCSLLRSQGTSPAAPTTAGAGCMSHPKPGSRL